MSELILLTNIGNEMERKLKSVGINSAEELKEIGSKEAWVKLKLKYPKVSLVHLYTLQGAVDNIEYRYLPEKMKQELRAFIEQWHA